MLTVQIAGEASRYACARNRRAERGVGGDSLNAPSRVLESAASREPSTQVTPPPQPARQDETLNPQVDRRWAGGVIAGSAPHGISDQPAEFFLSVRNASESANGKANQCLRSGERPTGLLNGPACPGSPPQSRYCPYVEFNATGMTFSLFGGNSLTSLPAIQGR
ncbi:MAG TPA: hypothetical protein VLV83_20395 [Acidobacteriota bacterium]|nr:hypothetical protein [Acidobacteriota bacterium]